MPKTRQGWRHTPDLSGWLLHLAAHSIARSMGSFDECNHDLSSAVEVNVLPRAEQQPGCVYERLPSDAVCKEHAGNRCNPDGNVASARNDRAGSRSAAVCALIASAGLSRRA